MCIPGVELSFSGWAASLCTQWAILPSPIFRFWLLNRSKCWNSEDGDHIRHEVPQEQDWLSTPNSFPFFFFFCLREFQVVHSGPEDDLELLTILPLPFNFRGYKPVTHPRMCVRACVCARMRMCRFEYNLSYCYSGGTVILDCFLSRVLELHLDFVKSFQQFRWFLFAHRRFSFYRCD